MNRDEVTLLMWRGAGLVLFTVALISIPQAIGALLSLAEVAYKSLRHDAEFAKIPGQLVTAQVSMSLTKLGTCVLLLFLGRWVFRGSPALRRWMGE